MVATVTAAPYPSVKKMCSVAAGLLNSDRVKLTFVKKSPTGVS